VNHQTLLPALAWSGLQLENKTLELNVTRKSLPGLMRQAGMKALRPVVEINRERKGNQSSG
jgi:hypothetical protein